MRHQHLGMTRSRVTSPTCVGELLLAKSYTKHGRELHKHILRNLVGNHFVRKMKGKKPIPQKTPQYTQLKTVCPISLPKLFLRASCLFERKEGGQFAKTAPKIVCEISFHWDGRFWGWFSFPSKTSLKTLTSFNKESRPLFLGDSDIWSFPFFPLAIIITAFGGPKFRFSVPAVPLRSGFFCVSAQFSREDGSGSGFGSWKTVPAVPVPLSGSWENGSDGSGVRFRFGSWATL